MNTVNTPDRLSLDAYADTERNSNAVYSSFNNTLGVAILNAKQLHLLRATIPNVKLQIPDYQLVLFYYNLPDATTVPNSTHLKAVRLYPSDYVPPSGFTTYTKNTYFTDPSTLATQLTTAGAASVILRPIINFGPQEMLLSPIQQRLSNSLLQEQEVEGIMQTLALPIRMFWPSSITQPLLQSPLPLAMEQPELI